MEAQKPYMMSLYEYLSRAAGSELGKQVADTAVKLRETIQEHEVSNPKYTGKVKLYRREFLDEYFGKKIYEGEKKQKIAVLNYSAGMDSTGLLLHLLAKDYLVKCVSFDYGQRHKIELERGTQQMEYLKSQGFNIERDIIDIGFLGKISNSSLAGKENIPEGFYAEDNMKSTVIENRNAIFASITYAYALSLAKKYNTESVIAQALHAGDHAIYKDCTEEFRAALEYAFKIGNYDSEKVSYYAPYMEGNKTSILKEALENCKKLNLEFDTIFKNTNTSYNPDLITGKASGKSGADVERVLAFHELGLIDPCEYVDSWDIVVEYALKVEQEFLNKI